MLNKEKISKSTVLHSLGWKILERVCSQGVNFLVQIVLARLIAPADFGSLAIILAITNYAAIFVQSGLATTLIQKKNLDTVDVNTILTASLFVALVMYAGLFFVSPEIARFYNLDNLVWPLRTLAFILFLNSINSVQTALLSRDMQFKQIFLRSVIAVPLAGAIGILLAYEGFGLWALVIYTLSSMALTVVVMALASPYRYRLMFSWERAKDLYSFSIKILFTSLISGFGDSLRVLIIGKKYNTSNLAYYEKAYTYSASFTQIVTSSVSSVLLPTFSRVQDSKSDILRMARRSVQLSSFCVIPFLTLIISTSYPLVCLLLTDRWAPCVPFLCIFCLLRIPTCISVIDKHVFYSLGNSKLGLYYELGLLLVNLSVLFYTVPISVMAIAIGYLFVEIMGCISIFTVSSVVYGYSLRMRFQDMSRPILNSFLVYLILSMPILTFESYFSTIIIKITLGIAAYIILSTMTGDKNISYIYNIIKTRLRKQ